MITLDASVVIAHLRPKDLHHEAATAYLRAHADEELLIHPLNLAEVLVGGVRVGRGDELQADLNALGIQAVVPREGEPLRLATLQVETGLKLPDCCALNTAVTSGSALATFDDKLAEAARARHVPVGGRPV
ncbi:type II toxin-antitoxin system VapC family toxin [Georgenia sp. Z1491]|uniref:type II toxin-antitoxin system VapC family toxin n=1 Tax=Georgenia sp. Z1491 TaxID=3416707 RepID=UPI003CF37EE9